MQQFNPRMSGVGGKIPPYHYFGCSSRTVKENEVQLGDFSECNWAKQWCVGAPDIPIWQSQTGSYEKSVSK
jgi:hypothetical protein